VRVFCRPCRPRLHQSRSARTCEDGCRFSTSHPSLARSISLWELRPARRLVAKGRRMLVRDWRNQPRRPEKLLTAAPAGAAPTERASMRWPSARPGLAIVDDQPTQGHRSQGEGSVEFMGRPDAKTGFRTCSRKRRSLLLQTAGCHSNAVAGTMTEAARHQGRGGNRFQRFRIPKPIPSEPTAGSTMPQPITFERKRPRHAHSTSSDGSVKGEVAGPEAHRQESPKECCKKSGDRVPRRDG